MKLTRSTNAKEAEFFRNVDKGNLIDKNNSNIDITSDVIDDLPFENSFVGRILLKPSHPSKKDSNRFNDFVVALVKNNSLELSKQLPNFYNPQIIEKVIDNSFSYYGKNLRYEKDGFTLKELLIKHYNHENIDSELNQLHDYIQTLIGYKKEKLTKSIVGNAIPFEIQNDKLQPKTKKMEFLFGLLNAGDVDKTIFEDFKTKYAYSILENKITKTVNKGKNLSCKDCKKIYDMVLEYNHNFYKEHETDADIDAYVFYLNEIKNHFRSYFPIKDKDKKKSFRLNSLNEKNAKYYCSERFVLGQLGQVWKHIVNQLVQGLIMYGKLKHYYYDKEYSRWEEDKINSNGLSEIQIKEAFKKRMFLSLCRGATRLNYFYNYGSQNATIFDTDNSKKADGDIFLDKGRRNTFYKKIKADFSAFEELKAKMATCYPLGDISNQEICSLLEEIVQSCYTIRNNVFHYKKDTLYEVLLKSVEREKEVSITFILDYKNKLLQRDIDNIQNRFREQIRSSSIADYYSLDTLTEVFESHNLNFFLYGGQYPMIPSFKNIFARGCNVTKGNSREYNTRWFMDKDKVNKDSYLAYKNLMQLIYYHSFIPAISNDEKIITEWINKTKKWKKNIALSKQPKYNKNEHQYRYNDMPDYEDRMALSDYLSNLQHLQSIDENENNEKKDKTENYYINFVKDIFAFAFNAYLQKNISDLYNDITAPSKQDELRKKERLDNLFANANLSLKMKTGYIELSEFGNMYLFLKLLDQRELNKLLHQFIKYRTSTKNTDIKVIEELIALVQFTLPPPDVDENYKQNLEQFFSKFIDKDYKTDYVKLYYDEDKKTPILQRSISIVGRSGAMALYTDIFTRQNKLYNVTKSDYNKYCDYNPLDSSEPSKIEEKQKELQKLHEMLVKVKNTSNMKEEIDKYEKLAKEIQEYNSCRQKVTFETLYKVNQIHIDILERFASFAEDWERDMFFMLTALKSLDKLDSNFNVNEVFEDGGVVGNLCKALKTSKQLFCDLCWSDGSVNVKSIKFKIRVRNVAAHLNHMTQYNKNGAQPSIIDIINKLRVLLAYDIKKQNAVTKSIKELLFKDYKIKLILEPEKTKKEPKIFKIKSLDTDSIVHLKNIKIGKFKKGIPIKANSNLLVDLTKELLEFKY